MLHAAEQCRRDHWEETSKEPALYAAKVVIKLAEESETILGHINRFMPQIAPSFSEVAGPVIAARFIAKARMGHQDCGIHRTNSRDYRPAPWKNSLHGLHLGYRFSAQKRRSDAPKKPARRCQSTVAL